MLEKVSELVRNLVVVIFLASLLEMLIPRGSFSRYLRLVTGLLVILLVVSLIGTLVNRLPEELALDGMALPAGEEEQLQVRRRQLEESTRQQALELYHSRLTDLIKEESESWGRGAPAAVTLRIDEEQNSSRFGAIEQVVIKFDSTAGALLPEGSPVGIEPVIFIFPADTDNGDGEGERNPELELALARRLQIPSGLVEVWEIN